MCLQSAWAWRPAMDTPIKIFAFLFTAYVVATALSTKRACGDKCLPTARGKQHQDPDPINSKSRASQLPCPLEDTKQHGHCFLLAAVALCGTHTPRRLPSPLSPPYLDHSSPFTSSSSQKGLWQLQHLPQPIHHHCLQLCAGWACSLQWGWGRVRC